LLSVAMASADIASKGYKGQKLSLDHLTVENVGDAVRSEVADVQVSTNC